MIRTEAITASGPCHNRKTYVARSPYRSANNRAFIPNYGECYRKGEIISTGFTESAVNQGASTGLSNGQQMRRAERGSTSYSKSSLKY
jgi:hypothetical protein